MNHAITVGGLLFSVGILVGLLTMAFGVLSLFGNMMADAAGDQGKSGCAIFLTGLAITVGSLVGMAL